MVLSGLQGHLNWDGGSGYVDCKISAKIGWSDWSCRVSNPHWWSLPISWLSHWIPCLFMSVGKPLPAKWWNPNCWWWKILHFFHETHWCFACEILHIWWALPIRTALWSNIRRCLPRSQTPREDLAGKRPGEWGVLGSGGSSGSSTKLYIDGPFRDTGLRWPKMVEDGLSPNVWPAN